MQFKLLCINCGNLGGRVIVADFPTPCPVSQQIGRNMENIGIGRAQLLKRNPHQAQEYFMGQVLRLGGTGYSTQKIREQRRSEPTAQVIKLLLPRRFHGSPFSRVLAI